ncbi:CRISPR-associated Cas6 family protein [Arcticibacter pallidicorallinus]|uniref:CRISPR-associated endoribonuclease n=1 Tax=Arcticibacter pallidicorallinus TaxID=1259464 RepID=A0A2T0TT22_9SPHI|nr:CRISPR-associated endoribonuclease Cas6 [Arcticibacter pallidicorallinus]PRY48844.1 CRISPR-associated Cas6 family protein [Arcticibacter pallidicorallinus]
MRFLITLSPNPGKTFLPYSYQYALSGVIYKKLALADEQYASFLHERGYSQIESNKHFKLFTYSNLKGDFCIEHNSLRLQSKELSFQLSCYMPKFAEHLIKGVFINQEVSIGGVGATARFVVQQVSLLPNPTPIDDSLHTVILKPISPLVVGEKNERGYYNYLSPLDANFIPLLKNNLREKIRAIGGDPTSDRLEVGLNLFPDRLRSRLVTIKENTQEESKVRGFYGFELVVKGTGKVINILMDCGLGMLNGMGFGSVEVKNS